MVLEVFILRPSTLCSHPFNDSGAQQDGRVKAAGALASFKRRSPVQPRKERNQSRWRAEPATGNRMTM
jgi:hypothetical protein